MSKWLMSGLSLIPLALTAALVGCQAPDASNNPAGMTMRQLPKASKVAPATTTNAQTGSLKLAIRGNFGTKARSVLYKGTDVNQVAITITDAGGNSQTLTINRGDNGFTDTLVTTTFNPLFPGNYTVQATCFLDAGVTGIGGGTTNVAVTAGNTTQANISITLDPVAAGAIQANITINDTPGE